MSLIYPVMAQVLLTLAVYIRLAATRVPAVRTRAVRLQDVALSGDAYPEDARKAANNVRNQFESPVLFYVLCGAGVYVGATGLLMTLLAWTFVATRVVHSYVHVTHNRVRVRLIPWVIGYCMLVAMWLVLAVHLLTA